VLFATSQVIATLADGNLVVPELLDGIVETAVDQFTPGSRHRQWRGSRHDDRHPWR
jgi:hypothetical protein